MTAPTPPTPEELALNLAEHAACLEPLCACKGVSTLYGPRGWYAMGHHLAAVHRALWAEAEVGRLRAQQAEAAERLAGAVVEIVRLRAEVARLRTEADY